MSREQEELEALKKMLETDGWRVFHREHSLTVESLRVSSWDSIKTLEQLHYMRGFLAALESVLAYDKILAANEEQLEEPHGPDSI